MDCDERDDQTRLLFDVSSSTAAAEACKLIFKNEKLWTFV